jgi:hypothetical protein
MFNVLSGLQEGSYSVATMSREATSPNTYVKGNVVIADANGKLVPCNGTTTGVRGVEFVFEDLSGQSSKKYTTVFGFMEAETDIVDESTYTIGNGDFLTAVAGKLVQAQAADITANRHFAKVTGVKAAGVDPCLGTPLGKRIQFRTV